MPPAAPPLPMARIVARGRPAADAACAGCAQHGLFRALRRAGVDVQGGPGCDPSARRAFEPAPGRWAAVLGAGAISAGARAALEGASRAGARLVVVADRARDGGPDVAAALAAVGARPVPVDPADLAAVEAAARRAAEEGGVLVALAPCAREAPAAAPLTVAARRCNRCGACLSLGCAAISDRGGEAMEIDPATCTGCGLCAGLCRARAIGR